MKATKSHELAALIVDWLRERNGAELDDAIGKMTVESYERMRLELAMILEHEERPPNWVSRVKEQG